MKKLLKKDIQSFLKQLRRKHKSVNQDYKVDNHQNNQILEILSVN